jgi:hypothetical protein
MKQTKSQRAAQEKLRNATIIPRLPTAWGANGDAVPTDLEGSTILGFGGVEEDKALAIDYRTRAGISKRLLIGGDDGYFWFMFQGRLRTVPTPA